MEKKKKTSVRIKRWKGKTAEPRIFSELSRGTRKNMQPCFSIHYSWQFKNGEKIGPKHLMAHIMTSIKFTMNY